VTFEAKRWNERVMALLPKTAKIKRVITENRRVKTFVLDAAIDARPGQFVMVWLPRVNEKPFSIMAANPLTLSIANVGDFTEKIHALKEGDSLAFRGPFGNGFKLEGRKILLVGGGYGAAPLRFLASEARENGAEVTFVLGAKTADELLLEKSFADAGCRVVVTTDDGSKGLKGFATDAVNGLLQKENFDSIYACGPERMMKKLAETSGLKQIPFQASLERYIKCGLGICGQCAVDGLRVCYDGPVFDASVLKTLSEFGETKRDASGLPVKL
jgi:dihydroorotate dehydrogenase electron transfer subunit